MLIHYGRSAEGAHSLVAALRAKGRRADAVSADLATVNGAASFTQQVRSIAGNRLDVLVPCPSLSGLEVLLKDDLGL